MEHSKQCRLGPGKVWAECMCKEIDPIDTPCIVCAYLEESAEVCPGCHEEQEKRQHKRREELS